MSYKTSTMVMALIGACALGTGTASALTLNYYTVGTGGLQTNSATPTAYSSLPVTDGYTHSYSSQQTVNVPGTSAGFYDDYIFSLPAAARGDSVTTTIDFNPLLGISNLNAYLYRYSGSPSSLPNTGAELSGVQTSTGTTMLNGVRVDTVTLTDANLPANASYVLEVSGTANGTAGGSYSGVLNLVPVPLPAALPLILGGLAVFGGAARRRREFAAA